MADLLTLYLTKATIESLKEGQGQYLHEVASLDGTYLLDMETVPGLELALKGRAAYQKRWTVTDTDSDRAWRQHILADYRPGRGLNVTLQTQNDYWKNVATYWIALP